MRITRWAVATVMLMGLSWSAAAVEITLSCGAVGQELFLCRQAAEDWAEKTGHTVKIVRAPQTTDQRFERYVEQLERGDASVDVYQIDVIWPGLIAEYFIDLKAYIPGEEIQKHYRTIIENNTVKGKLIGMPWFTDVGLLFYRKDLLAKYGARVPDTYSELADTALRIQSEERNAGNGDIWGFVFQGGNYEGLTCNALEWIAAYNGGAILNDQGQVTVNNPQAVAAIDRARGWVGTIAPPLVTDFHEEDARLTFIRGDAVFMRNWPYVWDLLEMYDMSPVAGKVDVAPLPKGGAQGNHASTLGGWQLAISKFSRNPKVASDLVSYLTGEEVQKQRAIEGSYAPTIPALYEDTDVLRANPVFGKLQPILQAAVARPTREAGLHYGKVSEAFRSAVHDVLQGKEPAAQSLTALEAELKQILSRTVQ